MKKPPLLRALSAALALASIPFLWTYGAYRWAMWRVDHPTPGTASSVAVIGGADGPTAIFVSAAARMELYLLLGAALLAGAAGLFLWARRITRKNTEK